MDILKRKGARSIKEVPEEVLHLLNTGEIPTVNLVEGLAINQKQLLENFLIQNDRKNYIQPIFEAIEQLKKISYNTVSEVIGTEVLSLIEKNNDQEIFAIMSRHKSDTIRCWATYFIGKNNSFSITEILNKIKIFAADTHFGVREIAWLSIRPRIAQELKKSIEILQDWTNSPDENIRRFATESTRPRGVWCKHIDLLKEKPELALSILEPLKSDSSKYVRDSVGNWLNDASKTQPNFVINICKRWMQESSSDETAYIVKKALRTINNK